MNMCYHTTTHIRVTVHTVHTHILQSIQYTHTHVLQSIQSQQYIQYTHACYSPYSRNSAYSFLRLRRGFNHRGFDDFLRAAREFGLSVDGLRGGHAGHPAALGFVGEGGGRVR